MSPNDLPESPYRRVLFCTDFSANADHAFAFALDAAARRPGCALTILHVIPEPEAQFWKTYIYELDGVDEKARRDIDDRMAEAYLSRVPAGVVVDVEVRIGRDYVEILDCASRREADLIVLGRHGRSGIGDLLFGGVADKVTRKAPCPVLVVPPPHPPKA